LKKQLDEKNNQNINKTMIENINQNSSDYIVVSNDGELVMLRESVDRLTTVGFVFDVFFPLLSPVYRKIVIYNPLHTLK